MGGDELALEMRGQLGDREAMLGGGAGQFIGIGF
jgi:hypothetical protein